MVDDDHAVCKMVGQMLEELQCVVRCANNGEEGLELFHQGLFDLVVSDVNMPGMDGIEMVRHICAADPTAVPIVITSLADQATAVRALEAKVHHFLAKPFSREDLQSTLDRARREHQHLVEMRLLVGDLIQMRAELRQGIAEQERKRARAERYLHHLLDAAPFAILSADWQGQILTGNRKAEELYGYRSEELMGASLALLMPGDQEVSAVVKDYHQHKDNTRFPVLVHRREILDEQQNGIAQLYVVEDLSQKELLEDQLFAAHRLSLLGQVASCIAHEFGTPLQLIVGHVDLALGTLRTGKVEETHASLEQVKPAVQQLQALLQQMFSIGRPQKNRLELLNLGEELRRIIEPLKHVGVLKYCQVEWQIEADLPLVQGDPAQLEQLFRNLAVNAAQAMKKSSLRVLTVQVRRADDGVEVAVRDTGCGIPSTDLERIFTPYFSTKTRGEGMGLGLTIVKGIAERHHGEIHVESQVGHGTCFRVIFPAVQWPPDQLGPSA